MAETDPETRATRLGVSILTFGLVSECPRHAITGSHECRLIGGDEWQAWRDGDDDDLDLANVCLTVEREIRDREWASLELLDFALHAPAFQLPAAVAGAGSDDLPPTNTVVLVPREQLAAAATLALGWHLPVPVGE